MLQQQQKREEQAATSLRAYLSLNGMHAGLAVSFTNFLAIILQTYVVPVSVLNAQPDQRRVYLSFGHASAERRLLSPRGATREERDSQ